MHFRRCEVEGTDLALSPTLSGTKETTAPKEKTAVTSESHGDKEGDVDIDEFLDVVRPNISSLQPYRCARDDYDEGVLLDANENTHGPPCNPFNYPDINLYPDPYQRELKSLVSKFRQCRSENIFVGVGSDEAIDLIIRVLCKPGVDSILITPPTYGMYKVRYTNEDLE